MFIKRKFFLLIFIQKDIAMFKINKIYKTSKDDIAMNIWFTEDIYKKYKSLSQETYYSFNCSVISAIYCVLENIEDENNK